MVYLATFTYLAKDQPNVGKNFPYMDPMGIVTEYQQDIFSTNFDVP